MTNEIFRFYPAQNSNIGILSIPHSGEIIPEEFEAFLTKDSKALACDVDYRVDHLVDIEALNQAGVSVIVSNIHRTCIDLNRSQKDSVLNWKKNSHGVPLVENEPDTQQRSILEAKYHVPYFEMLKTMINKLHKETDKNISFIDLHSMPSRPTEYHLKLTPNQPKVRPDFCVSDIEGLSCEKAFIDQVCENLKSFSTEVTQNIPYYGGHITRFINSEYERINNIQIEISRAIYMDEEDKSLKQELVEKLKPNLTKALIDQFRLYF